MAYSDTLNLVKGDTLPELTFTLRDSNTAASGFSAVDENNELSWAPIDLTGAVVLLRLREVGSTAVTAELTCALVTPASGIVATDFPSGTLSAAGTYEGEIEITFSDGGIQTVYDLLKLKVRASFD